jgi:hypothetical protein
MGTRKEQVVPEKMDGINGASTVSYLEIQLMNWSQAPARLTHQENHKDQTNEKSQHQQNSHDLEPDVPRFRSHTLGLQEHR